MLNTNATSITLRGTSNVEVDGEKIQVVTMSATINEVGHSSASITITNQQLYEENKETCRADMDSFTKKVREIEDAGIGLVAE